MISDKLKMLCLITFALAASSCGSGNGGGGGSDANNITVPQTADDSVNTDGSTSDEATLGTDTSDGTATPVASVSSAQMDAYVDNPLLTAIPAELNGGTSSTLPSSYITNPLMN